jgi:hypothetical protein
MQTKDEKVHSAKCDSGSVERLAEKLLDSEEENEILNGRIGEWIDSLDELSQIEIAFQNKELNAKTILDVGTDCVKPVYIALKFKPGKIIGINEELPDRASDIERNLKLFAETKVRFSNCSFFDKQTLQNILSEEKVDQFDFVLLIKTLHHLRTGKCVAGERDPKHMHKTDEAEECCIYGFEEQKIFDELLTLGKRVIVYEGFYPQDDDVDKVRGRGGYFTTNELQRIIEYLSGKYKVDFIFPKRFSVNKSTLKNIDSMFRQVDYLCFYIEKLP